MKSIAWAILLATAVSWAEYREIHCADDQKQANLFGPLIISMFVFFVISLVP
jgi:hypothetical protein